MSNPPDHRHEPEQPARPRLIRVIPAWTRPGGYGPSDIPQMRKATA